MNPIATITIEEAVSRFIIKNQKSIDNYSTYLENACEVIQALKTQDSNQAALGFSTTTHSYIPLFMTEMIASYILFKECNAQPEMKEETALYEKKFINEKRRVMSVLNNLSDT